MFGKPQWFRAKKIGWGLVPVRWQGWAYTVAWMGAIAMPFLLLIERHQPLEAMAWMGLAIGALTFDVWQVRRALGNSTKLQRVAAATTPAKDVLYIS